MTSSTSPPPASSSSPRESTIDSTAITPHVPLPLSQLPDPYIRGSSFKDLAEARQALVQYTVARGLSYKVRSSERRRYLVVCRSDSCQFRIRIQTGAKSGLSKTTVSVPHTCPPETHHGWKPAVSVKYLQPKHQAIFLGSDQRVKPKQIMEIEKSRGNDISYMQAWRTVKAAEAAAGGGSVAPPKKSKRGRKPKNKDPNSNSTTTEEGPQQRKQSKATESAETNEDICEEPAKEAPVMARTELSERLTRERGGSTTA
ncbi:hypothetical protein VTN00DRAFT_5802 [Thermoascus crustaceus]|uniref:uncharacterized protein n=1 Tax=Thermoascus crustaceus TaxID=5088 RepID=UPI0037422099